MFKTAKFDRSPSCKISTLIQRISRFLSYDQNSKKTMTELKVKMVIKKIINS